MKIVVFGAKGMLGRYISTYFKKQNYEVKEVTREEFNASKFNEYKNIDTIIHGANLVINCMGAIKPVMISQPVEETFMVNSIYPNYLARVCSESFIPCIHVTTDCVFDGGEGSYNERALPNMFDDYGFSKSIGDYCSQFGTVIRTSIIGEEQDNKRSLIEWAKSMKGQEVNGFVDHFWNGVTCLQLAKSIHALDVHDLTPGIFHLYSDTVSKAELLELISSSFQLDLKINKVNAPSPCDRTLSTIYMTPTVPSLSEQIQDLVGFFN